MLRARGATFRYTVYGALFGLLFPIFSTLLDLYLQQLPLTLSSLVQVQRSTPLHWVIDSAPLFLGLVASLAGRKQQQLATLNENLERESQDRYATIQALQTLQADLERQVARRTRNLEHQTLQLTAAAEIGRAASSTLDPDKLAQQTVDLLRERFDLYYAGLFLIDERGEYAVLAAGTGEPGRVMKERGHKLLVGGESMVGAACAERQARVTLDADAESVRFANPLLPGTHSEMALPLTIGNRVLGALDVQSALPDAFTDQDVAVMQLAADQVAVAVENARRFSSEATLLEATSPLFSVSRRLAEVVTTEQVAKAVIASVAETEADGCAVARFSFSPGGEVETVTFLGSWSRTGVSRFPVGMPLPAGESILPALAMGRYWVLADVLEEAQMPVGMRQALAQFGARAVANLPLRAGGRAIGAVIVQRATPGAFSPVSLRLYETLIEQAAVVLERARLVEETQRRAAQERWLNQAADQMQRAGDMGLLLRVAAQEVNRALGGSRTYIQIGRHAAQGGDGDVS